MTGWWPEQVRRMVDEAVAAQSPAWYENPEIVVPLGLAVITSMLAPAWILWVRHKLNTTGGTLASAPNSGEQSGDP